MSRLARLSGALLVAALLAPGFAMAHGGGEPLVYVPLDHVMPGQSFPLIGADLGPDAVVSLTIMQGDVVVPLGKLTAGPDGHFETTAVLPPKFPDGYAQLIASGSDGSRAAAWILVGERSESAAPPARTGWSTGRSVIVLALSLGGLAALAATIIWLAGRRHPRGGSAAS